MQIIFDTVCYGTIVVEIDEHGEGIAHFIDSDKDETIKDYWFGDHFRVSLPSRPRDRYAELYVTAPKLISKVKTK